MAFNKRSWQPTKSTAAADPASVNSEAADPAIADDAVPALKPLLSASGRDLEVFERGDVALKFWIPERLDTALSEVEAHLKMSRSAVVRILLFQYLYGRYDYMAMVARDPGFFIPDESPLRLSRQRRGPRGGRIPELRKNYRDVKVHLAERVKEDLQTSAEALGIALSLHVREILVTQLFGRMFLTDRQQLLDEPADYAVVVHEYETDLERWNREPKETGREP